MFDLNTINTDVLKIFIKPSTWLKNKSYLQGFLTNSHTYLPSTFFFFFFIQRSAEPPWNKKSSFLKVSITRRRYCFKVINHNRSVPTHFQIEELVIKSISVSVHKPQCAKQTRRVSRYANCVWSRTHGETQTVRNSLCLSCPWGRRVKRSRSLQTRFIFLNTAAIEI